MKAICLPCRNRSSLGGFCSSRLTFFLNWEFCMILFRAEAIFASSISKFGKSFPQNDRDVFNSSDCTGTSSAGAPCIFGSQADITIFGLSGSECWCYVYPDPVPLLLAAPLAIHEKNLKRLGVLEHCHLPSKFSLKSCCHSGSSEGNGSTRTTSSSSFSLFFFSISSDPCSECPRSSSPIPSLLADVQLLPLLPAMKM